MSYVVVSTVRGKFAQMPTDPDGPGLPCVRDWILFRAITNDRPSHDGSSCLPLDQASASCGGSCDKVPTCSRCHPHHPWQSAQYVQKRRPEKGVFFPHRVVLRLIGHQTFQTRVLLPQLLEPAQLLDPYTAVFLPPTIVGLLTHTHFTHDFCNRLSFGDAYLGLSEMTMICSAV